MESARSRFIRVRLGGNRAAYLPFNLSFENDRPRAAFVLTNSYRGVRRFMLVVLVVY